MYSAGPESQLLCSGAAVAKPSQKPRKGTPTETMDVTAPCTPGSSSCALRPGRPPSRPAYKQLSDWWVQKGSGILMALEGKLVYHLGSGLLWEVSLNCPISTAPPVREVKSYFPALHIFGRGKIGYHICSILPDCIVKFVELVFLAAFFSSFKKPYGFYNHLMPSGASHLIFFLLQSVENYCPLTGKHSSLG